MRNTLFFIFCLIFYACSSPNPKPKKVLSKEQMAEIIVDLTIYNQSYLAKPDIKTEDINSFVLKKHNITAEDFRENYQYYTYAPVHLDEIYDNAKKIILEKEPSIKDTLRKEEEKIKQEESLKKSQEEKIKME